MESKAHEAFATVKKHLGDGVYEIETNEGQFIVARLLPTPGVPDYYGTVVSADLVNDVADQLIGKPVYGSTYPQ